MRLWNPYILHDEEESRDGIMSEMNDGENGRKIKENGGENEVHSADYEISSFKNRLQSRSIYGPTKRDVKMTQL